MPNKEHMHNAKPGLWVKKDFEEKLTHTKEKDTKFQGIRKEALEKLTPTLNRLAKYDKQ